MVGQRVDAFTAIVQKRIRRVGLVVQLRRKKLLIQLKLKNARGVMAQEK